MLALRPFQRYLEFAGRSGRAEYWQWVLLTTIANWVAEVMDRLSSSPYEPPQKAFIGLVALATFIPSLTVGWRRFHDRGLPGWLLVAALMPILFAYLVLLAGAYVQLTTGSGLLHGLGVLLTLAGVGVLILAIVQLAKPGDVGPNAYGPPDPVAASAPPLSSYFDRFAAPPATPNNGFAAATLDTNMDALERLSRLRAQGHITEDEFAAQKQSLLGGKLDATVPPTPATPINSNGSDRDGGH